MLLKDKLKTKNIILASASPRRKELFQKINIEFTVKTIKIEESYPDSIRIDEIAEYLAKLKADAFINLLNKDDIIITADTIVVHKGKALGKPNNYSEAFEMLNQLSGNIHKVITGVCILTKKENISFSSETKVKFKPLLREEIDYYIRNYKPYDKAGAYGIQEWIGYIGVEHIEGSYFNVMGLPVQRLYDELYHFTKNTHPTTILS